MKELLTESWYNVQSIPYLIVALIFFAVILFVYIAPKFIKQISFLKNTWIAIPVVCILSVIFSYNLFNFMKYQNKADGVGELEKKELQSMVNLLETENEIQRTEIENLRHAALNVQQLLEIEEINLIETDMTTTIAHTEPFDNESNFWGSGSHGKQFWIVSQYNLKGIKYGVDLTKIQVLSAGNEIHVYGIQPKLTGAPLDEKPKDVLCEIRSYDSENGILKNEKVLYDAASQKKKEELRDKYHSIDMERIEKTTDEFEWINTTVEKSAQNYLETFLLPVGKKIVFEKLDINENGDIIYPADAVPLKEWYQNIFGEIVAE